jgi:hypothetical protein
MARRKKIQRVRRSRFWGGFYGIDGISNGLVNTGEVESLGELVGGTRSLIAAYELTRTLSEQAHSERQHLHSTSPTHAPRHSCS